jgi:hypothetical protein
MLYRVAQSPRMMAVCGCGWAGVGEGRPRWGRGGGGEWRPRLASPTAPFRASSPAPAPAMSCFKLRLQEVPRTSCGAQLSAPPGFPFLGRKRASWTAPVLLPCSPASAPPEVVRPNAPSARLRSQDGTLIPRGVWRMPQVVPLSPAWCPCPPPGAPRGVLSLWWHGWMGQTFL